MMRVPGAFFNVWTIVRGLATRERPHKERSRNHGRFTFIDLFPGSRDFSFYEAVFPGASLIR